MDQFMNERQLQQTFKQFNKFMLLMWRLGLGQWINIWPEGIGRIMVITHTGRKSGLKRQTPVNYAIVEGELYCTAAFGKAADWYRNIESHPEVEVWLPDGWWAGVAEDTTDSKQCLLILRQIMINSGFAAKAFEGIDPHEITEDELVKLTAEYRLIHIRRTEARTGPGGPGDLAWVWPLATFLLLPLALGRKKNKRT
jgi:deazaflavin-dependent oxidoreductase (nitroreductase family)